MVDIKVPYLITIFRSKYYTAIFVIALVIGYVIIPEGIFYSTYTFLGILFMITFSLTVTCIIRNVRDSIVLERTYGSSVLGAIATATGLGALHTCTIAIPVCGASIGFGILSQILPGFLMNIMTEYSVIIIAASMILQVIALYFMRCFKMVEVKQN